MVSDGLPPTNTGRDRAGRALHPSIPNQHHLVNNPNNPVSPPSIRLPKTVTVIPSPFATSHRIVDSPAGPFGVDLNSYTQVSRSINSSRLSTSLRNGLQR